MHSCDAPIPCFERDEHENRDKSPNRDCDAARHAGQIEITIQTIANLDKRTVKSTGRLKSQPVGAKRMEPWTSFISGASSAPGLSHSLESARRPAQNVSVFVREQINESVPVGHFNLRQRLRVLHGLVSCAEWTGVRL